MQWVPFHCEMATCRCTSSASTVSAEAPHLDTGLLELADTGGGQSQAACYKLPAKILSDALLVLPELQHLVSSNLKDQPATGLAANSRSLDEIW